MKLPCVLSCEKQFSFDEKGRVVCELIYRLDNVLVRDPGIDSPVVAKKGNWLCCSHGVWWLLSDYEKQKMTDYGN